MNILVILPSFPYPPDNGYRIKTFNLIEILTKYFQVEVLILQLKHEVYDNSYFEKKNIKHHIAHVGIIEKGLNLLHAIFNKIPFQSSVYKSKKVERFLKNNIKEYDFFLCSMIRTSCYLDFLPKSKVIFDMIDLLSKSYSKSLSNTDSLFYKLFYKLEIDRLVKMEQYVALNSAHVLLVNKDEKELFNKYEENAKWIPNGVNQKLFDYNKIASEYSNDVVFLGTMSYQPNVDAIVWLDRYVMDNMEPEIRVVIIGSNPHNKIIEIAQRRSNVILTGFLEDPYVIVNSCLAVLAPMQNGGGIQNKLLESMALGTINVVTSYAAKPIVGAEDGKHFLVKDDPLDYATIINNIHSNRVNYDFLKEQSKAFIKDMYTWDGYEKELIPLFHKIKPMV